MCLAQLFKSHGQAQLRNMSVRRQLQTAAQVFDGCVQLTFGQLHGVQLLQDCRLIGARPMRCEQKLDRRVPLAAADVGSRQELRRFSIGWLRFEQKPIRLLGQQQVTVLP
jgi:hypothetical protein